MATTIGSANPVASQASDTELAVFIPEIWTDAVRASFKKSLVMGNLAVDYSSLVSAGGDTINIPSVADVADAAVKAPHVPVNYTNATEDKLSIALSQHQYASAMVEDMGAVQSSSDLLTMYSNSIGYKLALGVEVAIEVGCVIAGRGFNLIAPVKESSAQL